MKTVEIIITPSGQSRVETKGFAGSECRSASRALEAALGHTISDRLTSGFYDQQVQRENHIDQGP